MRNDQATPDFPTGLDRLLAIAVGNSRTRYGRFAGEDLAESASLDNADEAALLQRLVDVASGDEPPVVVIATVRPMLSERVAAALAKATGTKPYLIGRDLPILIVDRLEDGAVQSVGQDRLLNALGAFSRTQQAAIVIDIGTAVTVDFVDGEGAFCGGAIAPGIRMMQSALHAGTELLPLAEYARPADAETFGTNTVKAINLGVTAAIRGLVRDLAERFALSYGGYPQIVATGGDAGVLEDDGLVEHIVPDLQLIGIQAACRLVLASSGND